jgi:hypothetical protein
MVAELKAKGHDVLWVGDWPRDPGDEEILSFALKEARTGYLFGGNPAHRYNGRSTELASTISFKKATYFSNARRPILVSCTRVRGFLPTKSFSTVR